MAAKVDKKKLREKLLKLHARLGTSNPHEREVAYSRIEHILTANKMNWNDLTRLLAAGDGAGEGVDGTGDGADSAHGDDAADNLLDRLCDMLRRFIHFAHSHAAVAVALWVLHCFRYREFKVSPRLASLSPVRGCGKTTLFELLETLTPKAERFDHVSAAAIYHLVDERQPTLLLDEFDNADLANNPMIRAVLNAGHRRGGKKRIKDREFNLFAPAAFAAIGTLPAPLMQRSIVIRMERAPKDADLENFDPDHEPAQKQDLDNLYSDIYIWSRTAKLDRNPLLPSELRNRAADNWRPLIAIADSLGRGEEARKAAKEMSGQHQHEDPAVELLRDSRRVFNRDGLDRIPKKVLLSELHEMEGTIWSEWRGVNGNEAPRKLSEAQLGVLLRDTFGIRSKTVWWPVGPRVNAKSCKGYLRAQFEEMWRSYCEEEGDTSAHASNVRYLPRHKVSAQQS